MNIKQLMGNVTQQQMVKPLGVTKSMVSLLVNGKRAMTPAHAKVFAEELGTTAEAIMAAEKGEL